MDGDDLSVCLFFRSSRGVNQAMARLREMGATIDQVGDTAVGATASPAQIDETLDLIKVSKLRPGDVSRFSPHTGRLLEPESAESKESGCWRHQA